MKEETLSEEIKDSLDRNAFADAIQKVHALLNPRNVVIAGATDKPGNWPQRVWRNLHRYNFPGSVFPLNPSRDTVWDTQCYRSFLEMPEPPDHIVLLVPARHVVAMLKDAAKLGARSATVMSSGFGESPESEGQMLADELKQVIAETGLAVSGPNCLGNFNVQAQFFSMPDDRPHRFQDGPVAVLGQSGGIVMAIKRALEERGINTGALITSGNESGLSTSDYIAYFAQHSGIRVIVCYLESVSDPVEFLAACRLARAAGKPVVVLKLGASKAGREAAAAHTGALAGSMEAFDAVAGNEGVLRLRNLDDIVEAVELLVSTPLPQGTRLGSITVSGGMRGLLLDSAEWNGLTYKDLSPVTRQLLDELLSVGTIIGNPLDAGYAALSSSQSLLRCVQILLDDPEIDILLLQDELPREAGTKKEENMRAVNALLADSSKPVAYVSMVSYGLTDYSRKLRAELPHIAFLQEVDKSLRVVERVTHFAASLKNLPVALPAPNVAGQAVLATLVSRDGAPTLDEVSSKRLLKTYGIAGPEEALAKSEDDAAEIATRIGYPVVVKLVSADVPHKSDIGGVIVGIESEPALRSAYRRILATVAAQPGECVLDGVLVAKMVRGGVELVLGMSHDPEMGPVILFGAGGVDIELTRDVALAAPPLDAARANELISRTRVGRILDGYRGQAPKDRAALVRALISFSHLVFDAGSQIDSIDINPFMLLETDGVALDALVILKSPAGTPGKAGGRSRES
jgi:acetate---CoA ligase (ADP-forming)